MFLISNTEEQKRQGLYDVTLIIDKREVIYYKLNKNCTF